MYWDGYKSYTTDNGMSVLAGPGLAWAANDHHDDFLEDKSHTRDLADACRTVLMEVGEDVLYKEYWDGVNASRKWFLQQALCDRRGQACYEGRDEL